MPQKDDPTRLEKRIEELEEGLLQLMAKAEEDEEVDDWIIQSSGGRQTIVHWLDALPHYKGDPPGNFGVFNGEETPEEVSNKFKEAARMLSQGTSGVGLAKPTSHGDLMVAKYGTCLKICFVVNVDEYDGLEHGMQADVPTTEFTDDGTGEHLKDLVGASDTSTYKILVAYEPESVSRKQAFLIWDTCGVDEPPCEDTPSGQFNIITDITGINLSLEDDDDCCALTVTLTYKQATLELTCGLVTNASSDLMTGSDASTPAVPLSAIVEDDVEYTVGGIDCECLPEESETCPGEVSPIQVEYRIAAPKTDTFYGATPSCDWITGPDQGIPGDYGEHYLPFYIITGQMSLDGLNYKWDSGTYKYLTGSLPACEESNMYSSSIADGQSGLQELKYTGDEALGYKFYPSDSAHGYNLTSNDCTTPAAGTLVANAWTATGTTAYDGVDYIYKINITT